MKRLIALLLVLTFCLSVSGQTLTTEWNAQKYAWVEGVWGRKDIIQAILDYLDQFDTVDWWRIEEGVSRTFDDPDWLVDEWVGSINGIPLAQATGSAQPFWIADQLGGFPAIKFDGSNDYLQGSFTEISQPNTIIIVCSEPTADGDFRHIFDGISINKRHLFTQDGSTNKYALFAGGGVRQSTYPIGTGFKIFSVVFNEGSSEVMVNGTLYTVSGDIGNVVLTGITLGTEYSTNGGFSDIVVIDKIVIDGGLTTPQLAQLELLLNRLRGVY